jgi:ankyrin repeat protein
LSDIFTVEKYLTEKEKKEKEKREKEEADKKLDKKLDKLRLIYLELARVPPGTTHPEVWENINNIRSKNIHDMFTHLCQMKRLDLAKELYDISLKKGNWVDIKFNFTFACSCNCANIDVLQWLLQIKPDIDISYNDELAFTQACRHGNLEIAKWLLQIKPDIKIPKRAISNARFWKHTEIVNWLLQIKPDIDT